jgi:BA14K-like protein
MPKRRPTYRMMEVAMKTLMALALYTGALVAGTVAATSASARSEPSAAQLANQLDQKGVGSTYVLRGGRRGGGRVGGAGYRGGHVGRVGGVGRVGRIGYGGRYGYGYARRGWGYGTGAAVAAGALVGGAVAASPYYYGETYGAAPVYTDPDQTGSVDNTAYCTKRFRSYDPGSGTYLGYDGLRHPCP